MNLSGRQLLLLGGALYGVTLYGGVTPSQSPLLFSVATFIFGGWATCLALFPLHASPLLASFAGLLTQRLSPRSEYPFALAATPTALHGLQNGGTLYRLDHALLHLNLRSLDSTPLWCNMGFWRPIPQDLFSAMPSDQIQPDPSASPSPSFIHACRQLALLTAQAAGMRRGGSGGRLLDVGFGCGDQLCLWLELCGDSLDEIVGVSDEAVQVAVAEGKVRRHQEAHGGRVAVALHVGDAVKDVERIAPAGYQSVVTLDSAYHFAGRPRYFRAIHGLLSAGGMLGLTDMVLGDGVSSSARWAVSKLARIPLDNLVPLREYRAQLRAAGFDEEQILIRDITEGVLVGFRAFLSNKAEELATVVQPQWLLRYRVLSGALDVVLKTGCLRYILVSCTKSMN